MRVAIVVRMTKNSLPVSLSDQARAILQRIAAGDTVNGVAYHGAGMSVPRSIKLLGSSTKVEKGRKVGITTAILYLAPADSAPITRNGKSINLCPWYSDGCRAGCLGEHAGRMVQNGVRNSREWKTALYLAAPALFADLIRREVSLLQKRAAKLGTPLAVRLDGTSDLGLADRFKLATEFPSVIWYDYTKSPARVTREDYRENRHMTYSASERSESRATAKLALEKGHSVAAIVSRLPEGLEWSALQEAVSGTFSPTTVIDGDETDARFLDTPQPRRDYRGDLQRGRGALVALSVKGGAAVREKLGAMVFEV